MNFKQQFFWGQCDMKGFHDHIERWHNGDGNGQELTEYLGITKEEMEVFAVSSDEALQALMEKQRKAQTFRIYQMELDRDTPVRSLAFQGLSAFAKEGYASPPGNAYRFVYQSEYVCPTEFPDSDILEQIFRIFNTEHPKDYTGRSLSVSDVVELYENDSSRFYFCDSMGFRKIAFDAKMVTV